MKVYLVRERKNINAVGEYDVEKKEAAFQKTSPIQKNLEGQRRLKKTEPEQ